MKTRRTIGWLLCATASLEIAAITLSARLAAPALTETQLALPLWPWLLICGAGAAGGALIVHWSTP